MSAVAETHQVPATVPFPSRAWFETLTVLMNANRARQEQLGYCDCVAQFTVSDGGPRGMPVGYRITFEEFSALAVEEIPGGAREGADFALVGDRATWRTMIESIEQGHGRPALEQTLNRLSHMGAPLRLDAADTIHADLYFRYNQTLQEFVNAACAFRTTFDG